MIHAVHGTIDRPEEVDNLDVATTGIVVLTHRVARERLAGIMVPFVPIEMHPESTPRLDSWHPRGAPQPASLDTR
jgi:hypothetical protein